MEGAQGVLVSLSVSVRTAVNSSCARLQQRPCRAAPERLTSSARGWTGYDPLETVAVIASAKITAAITAAVFRGSAPVVLEWRRVEEPLTAVRELKTSWEVHPEVLRRH